MPVRLYRSIGDLPQQLAIFPLEGALLLPRCELPLNIFEPRYLDMVQDAMAGSRVIGMIQPKLAAGSDGGAVPPVYGTGCCGRITSSAETGDGRLVISLTGIARFRIESELDVATAYRQIEADYGPFAGDLRPGSGEQAVDRDGLLDAFRSYLDARGMTANWDEVETASTESLVNTLAMLAPGAVPEKQALLEAPDLAARAEVLVALTRMTLAGTGAGSGRVQ